MRSILELGKVLVLLIVLIVLFNQSAYAQTAGKLNNKLLKVRLCPSTCKAVNGHGLKPGGNVTVLEIRDGWARVSPYLDRKTLVSAFGNKITKKPALWVAEANLASSGAQSTDSAKTQPKKEVAPKKPATVAERIARLRRVPIPVFRPTNAPQQPVEEAKVEETKAEEVKTEETKVEEPKVEEVKVEEAKPEEPKVETAKAEETEEKPVVVDTKPITSVAKGTASKKTLTWEEVQAKIAAQGGKTNNPVVAKTEPVETIKAEEPAPKKAVPVAKEEPVAKEKAPEPKIEEPKVEAPKAEEAKAEEPKEEPKVEEVKAVEAEAAPKPEEQTAAVDTTNQAVTSKPISFGQRPKKLTKPLLDKRLSKLPGAKSKVKKDVVIALRHYALGLLNSGSCKGIAGGGRSSAPGMLFVSCVEDPDYLRQFPLKELSW